MLILLQDQKDLQGSSILQVNYNYTVYLLRYNSLPRNMFLGI